MGRWLTMSMVLAGAWPTCEPLRAQHATAGSYAERLDRYIAPLLELQVFSGTVLVARGDRIILERSYGLADAEAGIRVDRSTVFRIASISKSFTRVLVGRLADQRKLTLDDTISRWLPAIPSANRITIRMLLDHRAGVPHVNSLPYDEEAWEPNTLAKLVDSLARARLDFEPGSQRRYSNGGYAILARVVELVTQQPFGTALEREILRPLRLAQTRHEADGMIVSRLARGYMPSPELPNRLVRAPFQEMNTKAGGGSLVSSARNLLTWARAIGRSNLLTDRMWAELFPDKDSTFALQGRAPGFNVILVHNRQRDMTTIVLANNYSAGMVADLAGGAEAIARSETPKQLRVVGPAKADSAELRALAGMYRVPQGALQVPPGTNVELRGSGDHIIAYLGAVPVDVLVPQGRRAYLARALWSIVEARGPGGAVDTLEVRALYRDSRFTATRISQ